MKNTNSSFWHWGRVPVLTLLIVNCSLLIAKAQNTYTLTNASCQTPCGAYNPLDDVWMPFACHNLGADTSLDPNTFELSFYNGVNFVGGTLGDLYQWGRGKDGHQFRNSLTQTTLATTNTPGPNFILAPTAPYDWRSPKNDALWGATKTATDPCPAGWKVPSVTQLHALATASKSWATNGVKFSSGTSNLFLPYGGCRNPWSGAVENVGHPTSTANTTGSGYYWSSTASGTEAIALSIFWAGFAVGNIPRGYGSSVRCVPE